MLLVCNQNVWAAMWSCHLCFGSILDPVANKTNSVVNKTDTLQLGRLGWLLGVNQWSHSEQARQHDFVWTAVSVWSHAQLQCPDVCHSNCGFSANQRLLQKQRWSMLAKLSWRHAPQSRPIQDWTIWSVWLSHNCQGMPKKNATRRQKRINLNSKSITHRGAHGVFVRLPTNQERMADLCTTKWQSVHKHQCHIQ